MLFAAVEDADAAVPSAAVDAVAAAVLDVEAACLPELVVAVPTALDDMPAASVDTNKYFASQTPRSFKTRLLQRARTKSKTTLTNAGVATPDTLDLARGSRDSSSHLRGDRVPFTLRGRGRGQRLSSLASDGLLRTCEGGGDAVHFRCDGRGVGICLAGKVGRRSR